MLFLFKASFLLKHPLSSRCRHIDVPGTYVINVSVTGCASSLGLPPPVDGRVSPGGSPTKSGSHSASTSPTSVARMRPRSKSTDIDAKKMVNFHFRTKCANCLEALFVCCRFFITPVIIDN